MHKYVKYLACRMHLLNISMLPLLSFVKDLTGNLAVCLYHLSVIFLLSVCNLYHHHLYHLSHLSSVFAKSEEFGCYERRKEELAIRQAVLGCTLGL